MIQTGYLLLTLGMAGIVIYAYYQLLIKSGKQQRFAANKTIIVLGVFLLFLLYNAVLGKTNFVANLSLPPRLFVFVILPSFLLIFFIIKRAYHSNLLPLLSPQKLTVIQSYRLAIELLFIGSVNAGLLNKEVTFEGYNFDLLFSISSILIYLLAYQYKVVSEKIVLYWNYLGLIVITSILFLFTTSIYFPLFWGSEIPLMPSGFADFYFLLVPSLLMPLAVFIHILSIVYFKKVRQF
ncbi:MAG: hypothetical protein V4538_06355 [Bacteroidota bacterium]